MAYRDRYRTPSHGKAGTLRPEIESKDSSDVSNIDAKINSAGIFYFAAELFRSRISVVVVLWMTFNALASIVVIYLFLSVTQGSDQLRRQITDLQRQLAQTTSEKNRLVDQNAQLNGQVSALERQNSELRNRARRSRNPAPTQEVLPTDDE